MLQKSMCCCLRKETQKKSHRLPMSVLMSMLNCAWGVRSYIMVANRCNFGVATPTLDYFVNIFQGKTT